MTAVIIEDRGPTTEDGIGLLSSDSAVCVILSWKGEESPLAAN